MAIELHVFFESATIPTLDSWQEGMNQLGFPAAIHAPFDPRLDRGFRPAAYRGQSTGFEFYLGPSSDVLDSYEHIAASVGNRDTCATFRWGGNLNEMSAALAAAATLSKLTDGIYYYPDDDLLYGADEAVEATRADLNLATSS